MKVVLDRKEFNHWLKFFGYNQQQMVEMLNYQYDLDLKYKSYNKMINGHHLWTLEAALGTAQIFDIPFEQLFIFK